MSRPFSVRENVPLAPFTTFRIGGRARYLIEAETEEAVRGALEFASERGLEVFILGGGSNILVSDEGFEGLVLKIATKGIETKAGEDGAVLVTAQAGEDWDEFVAFCVGGDLAGLECLSGIPGLVGGTPIQNVGAYGQEVSETIVSVRAWDRRAERLVELSSGECGFEYRRSIFNTTEKDRYVVLSVTYALRPGGAPLIVYRDLLEHFEGRTPSLTETREAVRRIRAEKGMLVRQGGPDSQSAGSFFKNPVVGEEEYQRIQRTALELGLVGEGESVPFFRSPGGRLKVPAAWLIERSGFQKGYLKGSAGLSTRHTLALTNRGGAKASEILRLKEEIQHRIRDMFGVELVPEPNLVGFGE